jgi:hypothetical protein
VEILVARGWEQGNALVVTMKDIVDLNAKK